jgi:hypothetical protein
MDLQLPPDFKEFLKLLKDHNVRYLLIGGYAVGIMDTHVLPKTWIFGLPFILRMLRNLYPC